MGLLNMNLVNDAQANGYHLVVQEGAELHVLEALDLKKVTFNVVTVEADGSNPEKDEAVTSLLQDAGYIYDGVLEPYVIRNIWYVWN